jgi:predicted thioredoxin/glutaredoxin
MMEICLSSERWAGFLLMAIAVGMITEYFWLQYLINRKEIE